MRAATCSPLIRESELRSSSVSPSEKYSCSLSPLMFTNGSTAIECGGGLKLVTDGRRSLTGTRGRAPVPRCLRQESIHREVTEGGDN